MNQTGKHQNLFRDAQGILLDIGCGSNKTPGFIGMDIRELPGVDIVHDLEKFPYPIESETVHTITASHIYEHIKPWLSIKFMDELWRILKVGGQLAMSMPYGWSYGYIQDPTHCNPANEATWQYFDPEKPLYKVYEPKPWKISPGYPAYQVNGNMEIIMKKISEVKSVR